MAKMKEYAELVESRLLDLREILARAKSLEEFRRPWILYSTLHVIQSCIQALLDMSIHLIAELGAKKPSTYRETAEILRKLGVLDSELAEKFSGMIGFRNLLVHQYARVSVEEAYRIAREEAERDIREVLKAVLKKAREAGVDP
ncbi:MAG: hypothetical protein DRN96_09760 [Thermoproteota archaeon]|nr:MAG: hypothetical protein DRN96_09760 [Candidatus Korarchaeota archaeon]